VSDDDGSGTVGATGTTLRAVPTGRFASMRSSYAFTADLTRRITVTEAAPAVTLESRAGRCSAQPAQVGAGQYEVVFLAFDGPASVVVRDARGAVVLERVAVRQELPAGDSEGQPYGVAEPAVLTLTEGEYTVECRPGRRRGQHGCAAGGGRTDRGAGWLIVMQQPRSLLAGC
jgi:hypothetical protein